MRIAKQDDAAKLMTLHENDPTRKQDGLCGNVISVLPVRQLKFEYLTLISIVKLDQPAYRVSL